MTSPLAAANAYSSLARIASGAGVSPGEGAGEGFGAMLKDALGSVVESGRMADTQSQNMAAGKANIVDVVTAVSETEVAVSALVSVRDKVIQAYEEIMRMPI
ncbi:MAG TPA: flagellar hook-basal body complex protein FliE [Xanthobacteraceae bacterium]|nr:flagellar hook-basal body complex protein FliE [Xanthobacteraceae bacterium]